MQSLANRVAIVTGGGRGIGRAIALALAEKGCLVAVVARTRAEVEQVAAEATAAGGKAIAYITDMADGASLSALYTSVTHDMGAIDILINNAGVVTPVGPFATLDVQQWVQAIQINVIGVFHLTRLCLPEMQSRRWGRIINVSSGAGSGTGLGHGNAYSVTKAGLDMLTKNLAAELAGSGVTVNAFWPGLVDTAMQTYVRTLPVDQTGQQVHNLFSDWHSSGLLQGPERPARLTIAMLESSINGEIIDIDAPRGLELLGVI
jgi:NAD(P)-dependent dehydrogenase (short-subunit alcohol dehydrogenase family)